MDRYRSSFSIDSLLNHKTTPMDLISNKDKNDCRKDETSKRVEIHGKIHDEACSSGKTENEKAKRGRKDEDKSPMINNDVKVFSAHVQQQRQQQQQQMTIMAQNLANLTRFIPFFGLLPAIGPRCLSQVRFPVIPVGTRNINSNLLNVITGPSRSRNWNTIGMPKSTQYKRYRCDLCHKAFSRSNTLITHKRIHTGEKPFTCEHCGRAFRQPGNLTRHRLTHTTMKPYVCNRCEKAFNRASNLHTHMRTHNDYRQFSCPYCGRGFHQNIDMKIHIYTHTGERPLSRNPY